MEHWTDKVIFYHIYPLGATGSLQENNFNLPVIFNLEKLNDWIPYLHHLGITALYLGPVFQSSYHGYDTADYFTVDRRLGTNETLIKFIENLHQNGIKVILDGVFHHVGRDFWAFKDVCENRDRSSYKDWFMNLNFTQKSPYNDPFSYDGWNGHYSLVKLNHQNPAVKEYLFNAVKMWIETFKIDGLRLDAADFIPIEFWNEFAVYCRKIKPEFYLVGEVIHGDYNFWANEKALNAVTNYELYKGLWSSLNDKNYYEVAYALNRQYGASGCYRHLMLYNFVDNHDVNRIASTLKKPEYLYPIYCLLFTIPGIPSIYYGSEWGIYGKKTKSSDDPLRPELYLTTLEQNAPHPALFNAVQKLIRLRQNSPALQKGNYQQIYLSHEQLVFSRETQQEKLIIALNSSLKPVELELELPHRNTKRLIDLLNDYQAVECHNGKTNLTLYPTWARVFKVE